MTTRSPLLYPLLYPMACPLPCPITGSQEGVSHGLTQSSTDNLNLNLTTPEPHLNQQTYSRRSVVENYEDRIRIVKYPTREQPQRIGIGS